ncbi:Transcription factor [Penicillium occitanis (nom. inval.)]|nr:hypothetical protein PENOC_068040 [Penicillium occitanis (nom. inval.)]PCH08709.1 Transcription factor [Penicillium occitanis (nom. inval.)]
MAMVGVFLNTLNSVLPLFHADTLLRLVGECYALHPRQRDPVIWAAINVVFALANQQVPKEIRDGVSSHQSDETTEYLNKAQSVISDIILGEARLINVQTLVGMVMVLQTAHNLKPSLILISATMRLVHQLGLHNHVASSHLDRVQRRQHTRVFWLAYILDKDLSLRAQQPSFQLDDDIDVELPSSWPMTTDDNDNTAGIVVTVDRTARMNYFLARVKLAKIEGHIYDCLYSTRALNQSLEERRTARENMTTAIYEWQASIPPEFGAAVVIFNTRDKPAHKGFFFVLHSSSLQCMTLINRAHAWDGQWVSGLRDHSRGIQPLKLPPGWERLVYQARGFMLLFREVWSKDVWFRWMTSCAYTSAMVLLAANNLYNTRHDRFKQEIELIDGALLWLNEAMREFQSKEIKILRDTCVEAVRAVKRKHAEDIPMSNWQRLIE